MNRYPALAGLRILVVEDDLMVTMMVEEMLQVLGCKVVAAVSAESEAIQILRSRAGIDGVLLDLHLHGRSTSAVVDELVRASLPFIITSGSEPNSLDAPATLSTPWLVKPFGIDTLGRQMTAVFGVVPLGGER